MNKKLKIFQFILIISCLMIGCGEDVITKYPATSYAVEEFWKSENDVVQATNQAYTRLSGIEQINWDGLTECVFCKVNSILQATSGGMGSGASIANDLWTNSYATIRQANFFFENVSKVGLSESSLAKYKGQWRFVRAWSYYKLLYQFGNVPLFTNVLGINQGVIETTNRANVLSFVLTEIDKSIEELSSSDYSPGPGRITKWAAMALKSRVLLYEGTLQNNSDLLQQSAAISKKIIDDGGFQLHPVYNLLFRPEGETSKEIILSKVYANIPGQQNSLTAWLAPISFKASWNQVTPTKALRDLYLDIQRKPINQSSLYNPLKPFENRDGRMYQTIFEYDKEVNYEGGIFKNDGTTYNFKKYIDPNVEDQSKTHTNWILFRLGEVYLNYAEAKNEVNGPSQDIIDLLNALMLRGGKSASPNGSDIVMQPLVLSGLTKDKLRDIIRRERIVELIGEGNVYYDYHRWKWLESTMNKPAEAISVLGARSFQSPRDYTWPIPDFELLNNPKLTQNQGW